MGSWAASWVGARGCARGHVAPRGASPYTRRRMFFSSNAGFSPGLVCWLPTLRNSATSSSATSLYVVWPFSSTFLHTWRSGWVRRSETRQSCDCVAFGVARLRRRCRPHLHREVAQPLVLLVVARRARRGCRRLRGHAAGRGRGRGAAAALLLALAVIVVVTEAIGRCVRKSLRVPPLARRVGEGAALCWRSGEREGERQGLRIRNMGGDEGGRRQRVWCDGCTSSR